VTLRKPNAELFFRVPFSLTKEVLTPKCSAAVKKEPSSIYDKAHSQPWASELLMPSIADRRREMMQNFLGKGQASSQEAGASEGPPKDSFSRAPSADTFSRTSSAPGAMDVNAMSEKDQIDNIFKVVKRNSISNRIDNQASMNQIF
jgi:hypothetical protein